MLAGDDGGLDYHLKHGDCPRCAVSEKHGLGKCKACAQWNRPGSITGKQFAEALKKLDELNKRSCKK
jgi:predicted ATP-dependent serine protease